MIKKIKALKPMYLILLFGVLPVVIVLMFIFKPDKNKTKEAAEAPAGSLFFANPETTDTLQEKTNLEIIEENKIAPTSSGGNFSVAFADKTTTNEVPISENSSNESVEIKTVKPEDSIKKNKLSSSSASGRINSSTNNKTTNNPPPIIQSALRRRSSGISGTMDVTKKGSKSQDSERIDAVIHNGSKTIKSGNAVRIRIVEACIIGGVEIPSNTIITGVASFGRERLEINITSIKYNHEYIACKLTVYDNDGILGLYVPGGVGQEIKEGAAASAIDQSTATISIPLIGSISTGALKKSVNDPSIRVYDNYKITLR